MSSVATELLSKIYKIINPEASNSSLDRTKSRKRPAEEVPPLTRKFRRVSDFPKTYPAVLVEEPSRTYVIPVEKPFRSRFSSSGVFGMSKYSKGSRKLEPDYADLEYSDDDDHEVIYVTEKVPRQQQPGPSCSAQELSHIRNTGAKPKIYMNGGHVEEDGENRRQNENRPRMVSKSPPFLTRGALMLSRVPGLHPIDRSQFKSSNTFRHTTNASPTILQNGNAEDILKWGNSNLFDLKNSSNNKLNNLSSSAKSPLVKTNLNSIVTKTLNLDERHKYFDLLKSCAPDLYNDGNARNSPKTKSPDRVIPPTVESQCTATNLKIPGSDISTQKCGTSGIIPVVNKNQILTDVSNIFLEFQSKTSNLPKSKSSGTVNQNPRIHIPPKPETQELHKLSTQKCDISEKIPVGANKNHHILNDVTNIFQEIQRRAINLAKTKSPDSVIQQPTICIPPKSEPQKFPKLSTQKCDISEKIPVGASKNHIQNKNQSKTSNLPKSKSSGTVNQNPRIHIPPKLETKEFQKLSTQKCDISEKIPVGANKNHILNDVTNIFLEIQQRKAINLANTKSPDSVIQQPTICIIPPKPELQEIPKISNECLAFKGPSAFKTPGSNIIIPVGVNKNHILNDVSNIFLEIQQNRARNLPKAKNPGTVIQEARIPIPPKLEPWAVQNISNECLAFKGSPAFKTPGSDMKIPVEVNKNHILTDVSNIFLEIQQNRARNLPKAKNPGTVIQEARIPIPPKLEPWAVQNISNECLAIKGSSAFKTPGSNIIVPVGVNKNHILTDVSNIFLEIQNRARNLPKAKSPGTVIQESRIPIPPKLEPWAVQNISNECLAFKGPSAFKTPKINGPPPVTSRCVSPNPKSNTSNVPKIAAADRIIQEAKLKVQSPTKTRYIPIEIRDDDDDDDVVEIQTSSQNKTAARSLNVPSKPYEVTAINSLRNKFLMRPEYQEGWIASLAKKYEMNQERRKQELIQQTESVADLSQKTRQTELDIQKKFQDVSIASDIIQVDDSSESEEESEFPELSSDDKKFIEHVSRNGPSQEVIIEKFNLNITRRDLSTLVGLNWLNDEVINFYMNLLTERSEQLKDCGYPAVYAMNTFFVPRLMQSGHSGVRRWTRKVNIFSYDIIPVPVHVGQVHWCMAIIHLKDKTIKYYDSMGTPNPAVLRALENYLKEESLDKRKAPFCMNDWDIESVRNLPRQMNGSDCGVFSCMFAEYITRNKLITFSQKNMEYFRQKMIFEIAKGKLLT